VGLCPITSTLVTAHWLYSTGWSNVGQKLMIKKKNKKFVTYRLLRCWQNFCINHLFNIPSSKQENHDKNISPKAAKTKRLFHRLFKMNECHGGLFLTQNLLSKNKISTSIGKKQTDTKVNSIIQARVSEWFTEKKHELETISVCGDDGAPPSGGVGTTVHLPLVVWERRCTSLWWWW